MSNKTFKANEAVMLVIIILVILLVVLSNKGSQTPLFPKQTLGRTTETVMQPATVTVIQEKTLPTSIQKNP